MGLAVTRGAEAPPPPFLPRTIEVGVTHEVKINGDSAWVKFGVTADVTNQSDVDRVIDYVNSTVLDAARKTHDAVSAL